jgi:myosin heavy subunit
MNTLGFGHDEQMDFLRVAAAVLHLGNISVEQDRNDQAEITDFSDLERACQLLGVPVQEFCTCLLAPQIKAGRDWVVQARNRTQVISSLDALAKVIYERSFGRLVERINREIDGEKGSGNLGFIGVLDIAGFEIFEVSAENKAPPGRQESIHIFFFFIEKQLRATVHQLYQRKATTIFQPQYIHS